MSHTPDPPAVSSSPELETLARLARAATPGPWVARVFDAPQWAITHSGHNFAIIALTSQTNDEANARFLAECTPERILGLIEAAQQGAEDAARLDWLGEQSAFGRNHSGGKLWVLPDESTQCGEWRDVIDAARAPSPESSDHAR